VLRLVASLLFHKWTARPPARLQQWLKSSRCIPNAPEVEELAAFQLLLSLDVAIVAFGRTIVGLVAIFTKGMACFLGPIVGSGSEIRILVAFVALHSFLVLGMREHYRFFVSLGRQGDFRRALVLIFGKGFGQ